MAREISVFGVNLFVLPMTNRLLWSLGMTLACNVAWVAIHSGIPNFIVGSIATLLTSHRLSFSRSSLPNGLQLLDLERHQLLLFCV